MLTKLRVLANGRLVALLALLVVGSLATGSAALTLSNGPGEFRPATTVTTAGDGLNPVVIGSSESPSANDPLVKVEGTKSSADPGSADGAGRPRGYTGLFKLGGLVVFLVFAWGWWAWGGQMPVKPAASPSFE